MTQIVKTNITQQVFAYLKENIENETWPVGSKIPSENQLTEMLTVSRSSVRMAIQQLIALDILESQHGRGTFVKHSDVSTVIGTVNTLSETDYDNIQQVLEFRIIVEKESAYLAAKNATPEIIANLERYLLNMKNSIGNAAEFVRQDMLFHREISRASGNRILTMSLCDIFEKTAKNHQQLNELFGYKDGIYYHTLLLKAIKEGAATQAKRIMIKHLQQAIDNLPEGSRLEQPSD